jgi:hypothetical protein
MTPALICLYALGLYHPLPLLYSCPSIFIAKYGEILSHFYLFVKPFHRHKSISWQARSNSGKIALAMNAVEERIYQLAKPYLNTRHNDVHTDIALDLALRLLEKVKGNRQIVIPAIILHDVGWSRLSDEILPKAFGPKADMALARIHEEEGVKIAKGILAQVGYDSQYADEILHIIDGHDTRTNAISIDDEIVRDADRLARYSRSLFWLEVEWFQPSPEKLCRELEFLMERWFSLSASKEIAREELEQRRRELQALRWQTNGLPAPGTESPAP